MNLSTAEIKLSAINSLYGQASRSLVRITADHDQSALSLQIVCLESAAEDDLETLRCFVTEFIATVGGDLKEEFLFVSDPHEATLIKDREIKIFALAGSEFIR